MGLRDILRKKDELQESSEQQQQQQYLGAPQFVFVRSDTATHEIIQPPDDPDQSHFATANEQQPTKSRRSVFRPRSRSRSSSLASSSHSTNNNSNNNPATPRRDGAGRRLSHRLHLARSPNASSEYVPENLPEIPAPTGDPADRDAAESEWEKRATILAGQNERARSRPASPPSGADALSTQARGGRGASRSRSASRPVSSQLIDEDIQKAIHLHESGDLERSTQMFGRLADPNGANNPLSQVLYGLALRHGWGCQPDPAGAVRHLTAAASNAASVEQLALQAGMKKGGAAKGELVLAIFELANCFRHGWGIDKDPIAAKQVSSHAMNEVAWCYLEGYGCKKDKHAAARYYRQAEKAGNKTLGNSWIWKEKYDPPGDGTGKKK
ncbi:hypothetical protein ACO1O0_001073 [Amphichorda felina]